MRRSHLLVAASCAGALLAATVVAHASTTGASPSVPGWATEAVARTLLGSPHYRVSEWQLLDVNGEQRYQATVVGYGLAQFDARTHELDQLICDEAVEPSASLSGPAISKPQALALAANAADRLAPSYTHLRRRGLTLLDHGSFAEYRVTWQALSHGAWLPDQVVVGINARTGAFAYFWANHQPVVVNLDRAVDQATAVRLAFKDVGRSRLRLLNVPSLEVIEAHGQQKLVWLITLTSTYSGPHIASGWVRAVDAHSGAIDLRGEAS